MPQKKPQRGSPPIKVVADVGPRETRDFFGDAPLIRGEDPAAYQSLLTRVSAAVQPKDVFEEMWMRDVVDLAWEVFRWRRLKVNLLQAAAYEGVKLFVEPFFEPGYLAQDDDDDEARELSRRWARREPEALQQVGEFLAAAGLTMDAVMAQTLAVKMDSVERIDRMLANAEARRDAALREIDRHRDAFAAALRRAAEEPQDAEFREIGPAKDIAAE
jgi:hypothetical protein